MRGKVLRSLLRESLEIRRPNLFWRASAVLVMLSQLLLVDTALAQSPVIGLNAGTSVSADGTTLKNNSGTLSVNLANANTWTAAQTFNAQTNIAAGQQIISSDGASASWSLQVIPSGTSILKLQAFTGTAQASVNATSNGFSGLWSGASFGTAVPTFVRTGSSVAGTQLTDSVTGDPLVIAPSGNAVRIGVTGTASTLQISGSAVTIPSQKATTGTRYACFDTNGKLVSSTTACSGT